MSGRRLEPAGISCCHNFLPVSPSNAWTSSFCTFSFGSVIDVANTRPAATAGEPMPSPSIADQRTFFLEENIVGNACFEEETPVQFGPRNCGQSSAES